MNDDQLITMVRESFTGVRTATGVEQIVGRSRVMRARRRVSVLAGALALTLALVAGTALAVTAFHPGGRPASPRRLFMLKNLCRVCPYNWSLYCIRPCRSNRSYPW